MKILKRPDKSERTDLMGYTVIDGKEYKWTYQDELMNLLDMAENYAAQYEFGNYSAMRELVRDVRRIIKRCDVISKGGETK